MAYKSTQSLFRDLSDTEEEEFRVWARNNDPKDWKGRHEILHPIVCDEWEKLGKI